MTTKPTEPTHKTLYIAAPNCIKNESYTHEYYSKDMIIDSGLNY